MSAGPAAAHRPTVRRSPAPRAPRRVSGPARGRGPAKPRVRANAGAGAVALPQPLAPRVLGRVAALPDSRWLDRLMRGRAWIAIVAAALIGLVFMQVSMLRLNAGIGEKVERSDVLERQNADLRNTVSQLSSEERIQRAATDMGLIMPPAGDVTYLRARGAGDAARAAKVMRAPNAAIPAATAAGAQEQTPVPPTEAAQQAQAEEQAAAGTAPGAATTTDPQATTAQPQAEQAAPVQAQTQTQTQVQPQAQATAPPQQQQTQAPPAATTAGAVAAPGTGQ